MIRALAVALAIPALVHAQVGVLVQGVADVETWKTDTMSTLLRRNGGDPSALVRLRMWSAIEPKRGVFLFANAIAEGGNARRFDGPGTTVALEQAGLRIARRQSLVIDAGRMIHPVGAFGARVLSTRNPLIGIPDAYLPTYPIGAMASGERGKVDYRVAMVTLPPTHRDYVPDPHARLRAVAGLGVTPRPGLRVGLAATEGPYLNDDLSPGQLDGRDWQVYHQRLAAMDFQYGVGHFDLRTEFVVTEFEVPYEGAIDGQAGYTEARATLNPRIFVAVRGEFNRYPFIRPASATSWVARRTELRAIEAGGGFRFGANTVLKATFMADDWVVTPENAGFIRPGGKAVALQLSRAFDLSGLRVP